MGILSAGPDPVLLVEEYAASAEATTFDLTFSAAWRFVLEGFLRLPRFHAVLLVIFAKIVILSENNGARSRTQMDRAADS